MCFPFFHHWHTIEPQKTEVEYPTTCHLRPKATATYHFYRWQCCRCGKIKRQKIAFEDGMEDYR